jgi:hypothetical protein
MQSGETSIVSSNNSYLTRRKIPQQFIAIISQCVFIPPIDKRPLRDDAEVGRGEVEATDLAEDGSDFARVTGAIIRVIVGWSGLLRDAVYWRWRSVVKNTNRHAQNIIVDFIKCADSKITDGAQIEGG